MPYSKRCSWRWICSGYSASTTWRYKDSGTFHSSFVTSLKIKVDSCTSCKWKALNARVYYTTGRYHLTQTKQMGALSPCWPKNKSRKLRRTSSWRTYRVSVRPRSSARRISKHPNSKIGSSMPANRRISGNLTWSEVSFLWWVSASSRNITLRLKSGRNLSVSRVKSRGSAFYSLWQHSAINLKTLLLWITTREGLWDTDRQWWVECLASFKTGPLNTTISNNKVTTSVSLKAVFTLKRTTSLQLLMEETLSR